MKKDAAKARKSRVISDKKEREVHSGSEDEGALCIMEVAYQYPVEKRGT